MKKYTVTGRIYSEIPMFYDWDSEKRFAHYDIVSEHVWNIEADSMRDARAWLANNYPECYMGASIVCENGDFAMLAVPCSTYCDGNYETLSARIQYVRNRF